MDDLQELRAALIQLAKAQETERACTLRILRWVERRMEQPAEVAKVVADSLTASIASAANYRVESG